MNIAIIYHDADYDGKLSNEVCRYFLERNDPEAKIHSYGWDYGRPVPDVSGVRVADGYDHDGEPVFLFGWDAYDSIYIVDLSVDELMARPELRSKIVWIDHHKSAIEKWDGIQNENETQYVQRPFKGTRIDGVAACRLCWTWFTWGKGQDYIPPLTKSVFVDREIKEPELLRLAGEYDIWDHRDPDAKALQFGLRALSDGDYQILVNNEFLGAVTGSRTCSDELCSAVKAGHSIKSYCDKQNDEYSAAYSHTIKWEGLNFCALNTGQRGNSDLLRGGIKPEHDACFAWRYVGNGDVMVSLYHIAGNEHHDLSKIAVKYGGGGHKGACGFRITLSQLDKVLSGGGL